LPPPACCAAALHGLSPLQTHIKLAAVLTQHLAVAAVLDLGTARDLALLETAAEFIARLVWCGTDPLAHFTLRCQVVVRWSF
jgi:iron only hydrogenase large subunit-like protein